MLIIFDLDDTLIDTSGCITPIQLTSALQKLISYGVVFPSFDKSVESLLRLNQTAPSARHAVEEFFEISGIDAKFLDMALQSVYEEFSPSLQVDAHDMALDILVALGETHKLALVTIGKEDLQLLKLKKAGIHSEIFSKIIITQERNKKVHYNSIVEELEMDSSEVIVCGDRISVDLTPAKELGFKTVHMRSGRGLHCKGDKNDVDFTISHLSEILQILPQVSNITSLMGNIAHDDK